MPRVPWIKKCLVGLTATSTLFMGTMLLSDTPMGDTPMGVRDADACGYMMPLRPRLSLELGQGDELPKGARGVYFRARYFRAQKFDPGQIQVRRAGKGTPKQVAFSVEETDTEGRYYLAFESVPKVGDKLEINYDGYGSTTVLFGNQALTPTQDLRLDVSVDKSGRSSLAAKSTPSTFSPLYQYRYHLDGERASTISYASFSLAMCETGETTQGPVERGWHELSVEVWPAGNPELTTTAAVDIWVDCRLASDQQHPSITKSPDDFFVPSTRGVAAD